MSTETPIDLEALAKDVEPTPPLLTFDNWFVNTFVPPLLLGLAWMLNNSPMGGFMQGFHIWMHEFGHATAAWLCGRQAMPLPFGWTSVNPEYSPFVYYGLLLLFVIMFVAGWKERTPWAMVLAVILAGLQYYMTWRMSEDRQEFWYGAFCGVGGEFYLSAGLMVLFYMQFPDKFRWGICRYVFFFIAASAFLHIVTMWNDVYHLRQDIPMGSMIGGEDDSNGDMNKLMDDYGWSEHAIRHNYQFLGYWCWTVMGVVYMAFVLRVNLLGDWISQKFGGEAEEEGTEEMKEGLRDSTVGAVERKNTNKEMD